jgi:hypothetical protein
VQNPRLTDVVVRQAPIRPGEGVERGQVDREGAEASTDDRDAVGRLRDAEAAAGHRGVRLQHRARDRSPGDHVRAPVAPGDRKRQADASRPPGEQAVGEPEVAVGLGENQGQPHADRRQPGGPRDVSAAAQDDLCLPAFEGAPGRPDRATRSPGGDDALQGVATVEPADSEEVDLIAGRRDKVGLVPLARSEEADLRALSAKHVGDGDRRHDVPRRAAGRYHDSCHLLRALSY